jgi:phosphoglycolate phosphatase
MRKLKRLEKLMTIRCLLFDLDGTLIDSREDLADSVNLTLAEMRLSTLPSELIASFIGEGVFNLLSRSLSASLQKAADQNLTDRSVGIFREFYGENILKKTRLYDGVAETLNELGNFKKP